MLALDCDGLFKKIEEVEPSMKRAMISKDAI